MPVPLRTDFDGNALRAIARQTKDGPQARRLLALAAIYDGASRTEAARIGGATVQIVRDWVVKIKDPRRKRRGIAVCRCPSMGLTPQAAGNVTQRDSMNAAAAGRDQPLGSFNVTMQR